MKTQTATRRSTLVGWLLIFLAAVAVVAGVSANAVKSPGSAVSGTDDSTAGESPSEDSVGKGFVPKGVSPEAVTEQNAASTDQSDPKRFRIVADGVIEDAATGIRRNVDGVKTGQDAPSPEAIREFNSANSDLRSDLSIGADPEPTRLVVESINLDAEVVPIGLDANQALAVPKRADITGWWSGGYKPGESGPTVIVGHYDSKVAPGVFARLKDVQELDRITVQQADGSKYFYEVEFVERLQKTEFPTELVYGPTAGSTLRLVTCGGKFDHKTHHYVDNVIVYASLIGSEMAGPREPAGPSSPFGPDSLEPPNTPPGGFGANGESGPHIPTSTTALSPTSAPVPSVATSVVTTPAAAEAPVVSSTTPSGSASSGGSTTSSTVESPASTLPPPVAEAPSSVGQAVESQSQVAPATEGIKPDSLP